MRNKGRFSIWQLLGLLVLLLAGQGCSNLKYLEEGQELYTGSRIDFEKEEKISGLGRVEDELEDVMKPEPNATFLGLRPRLWLYNIAGEPTGKGLRHLLRNRFGRPPVLFEQVSVPRTSTLLENRLRNLGFFDASVAYEVKRKEQKASVDYTVTLRPAYTFGTVHPLEGQDSLSVLINRSEEASLIKTGNLYRLETFKEERERLDRILKSQGYYYFHPDFLLFQADTTKGERSVEVFTTLKPDNPPQAAKAYRIRNVYVHADYLFDSGQEFAAGDSLEFREGLYVFDREKQFKPAMLADAIFLRRGELYDVENHDRTLNHLLGLGVFKFVNIRFEETLLDSLPALDVRLLLTPVKKKSLNAEILGIARSNRFAGPGLNLSFSNRNALGGAEQLRFSTNTSFETLIARNQKPANSVEAGLEGEFIFPRFVIPFNISRSAPILLPKTSISLGFNYLSRTDAFNLSSIKLQYGYSWNQKITSNHRLSPVVLNWFKLGRVSENASGSLVEGALLRRGLFEQFIIGSEYSLTINSQLREKRRNDWYLNVNADLSGNLARGLFSLVGAKKDTMGSYQIFGQAFSQYARSDFDIRFYHQINRRQRIATRFIAGVGVPFGNSQTLPYVKRFNIGGSNSIRAFHPRTLGPGAYQSPDSLQGRFNIHQSGDVKLELNLEFRFDITRFLKGAFFVDAGNVWRLREDTLVPGGQFHFNRFYEQIAVGTGTGLRIDVNFFVLRFDFAFPLVVPWEKGFSLHPVQPFNKAWRRENLIFNLGIGYPF